LGNGSGKISRVKGVKGGLWISRNRGPLGKRKKGGWGGRGGNWGNRFRGCGGRRGKHKKEKKKITEGRQKNAGLREPEFDTVPRGGKIVKENPSRKGRSYPAAVTKNGVQKKYDFIRKGGRGNSKKITTKREGLKRKKESQQRRKLT